METYSYEYLDHLMTEVHYARRDKYRDARRYNMPIDEDTIKGMDEFVSELLAELQRRDKLGIRNPKGWCDAYEDDWSCSCERCKCARIIQRWWCRINAY